MPRFDGRGPRGQGPNTGRGVGNCSGQAKDDLSIVITRFVINNWRPIAGFLMTTLIPLVRSKMLSAKQIKTVQGKPIEQADSDPTRQIEDKSSSK